MFNVMAGARILCSSFQKSEAGAVLLLGMWESLVDLFPLGMWVSLTRPALEVAHVSLMADGMVPLSTPRLTCVSLRGLERRVHF